jgi:hypothetical protein
VKPFFSVLGLLALFGLIPHPADAQTYCSPREVGALILDQPRPDAIHKDWTGNNMVGTGWSLARKGKVKNATGEYLRGDLLTSRGNVGNRNVYVLESEWECR